MRKTERDKYRKLLLGLKVRLSGTVEGMRKEALEVDDSAPSDDHMADHGSAQYDQDVTLSIVESEQERIRDIDEALERIEAGSYGNCEGCKDEDGNPKKNRDIPRARLEALPYTKYCVDCQERLEELGEL